MKHLLYSALAIILLGVSIPMTIKAGNPDSTVTKKTSYTPRESGWYTTLNIEPLAVNVSGASYTAPFALLSVSAGYQICPYVAVGGGIGYRGKAYRVTYKYPEFPTKYLSTIPVFLDVYVNLNNKRVTPYFPISIGYNLIPNPSHGDGHVGDDYAWVTNAETTTFASVGFGMKIHMGKASTWNLAATLTTEEFKYSLKYVRWWDHQCYKFTDPVHRSFLFYGISTGFTF